MGVRPRREAVLQKKTLIASERHRPAIARRRAQWAKYQGRIDPSRLVFIDGSEGPSRRWRDASPKNGTKTNMAPLRGWAPSGQRLIGKAPHAHWQTCTFIAALRHDRVEAPWLLDGPVNGECFQLYVEKVLVPTLKPRDIVIMDNLGSHKAAAVRRAIRAAGATLLYLPNYSPDLNPIEQLFATLKHWLRNSAERSHNTVRNAIAQILATISATECANDLANAGYART